MSDSNNAAVHEEQKTQLLSTDEQNDEPQMDITDDDDLQDELDAMRPNSSRVKKVLNWDPKHREFEMDEKHKKDLQEFHIKNKHHWDEFEALYKGLPPQDHPQIKKRSCCKATFLYSLAFLFLLGLAYLFFIVLQLALFNLIMLVVMAVWWWKLVKICKAIINRVLDNGRKSAFKAYIKKIKDLEWLKELSIEIQENDEGKWIEIHLNETADDNDNDRIVEEEDEDN